MTGNDIVDINLAATESNWKRKGFFEKIFTQQEQQYIHESTAPDEMVWKLWTMKESAYKIYTQQYSGRFFAPHKFCCTIINTEEGTVEYDSNFYLTTSISTQNFIYSTAKQAATTKVGVLNSYFLLPEKDQQQFIRNKIIQSYNNVIGKIHHNISVEKDKNGIPFLHCGSKQIPLSITHHGRFAAFTID